tara:strand:- start:7920 stop:8105 length:186 start_codon:yes stop_codon:yes gene_type:complete
MRCKACETLLEQEELYRRDKNTNEFIDLCNVCHKVSTLASIQYEVAIEDNEIDEININDFI